jgi:hypothetical protein
MISFGPREVFVLTFFKGQGKEELRAIKANNYATPLAWRKHQQHKILIK